MLLTVFLILLLLAALAAGVVITRRRHQATKQYLSAEDRAMVHVRWHELEQRTQSGGTTNYRQAIIEADSLVDFCLKQMAIEGDTMGERMRNSEERFTDYNGLWTAHKLRNQLVHELNKELHSSEAKENLTRFRRALSDLGVV